MFGITPLRRLFGILALLILLPAGPHAVADEQLARAAMSSPDNPLLRVDTSAGALYIELFQQQAPTNTERVLALAGGEFPLIDPSTDTEYRPRYYDGLSFHRSVPGLLLAVGSPHLHPLGGPPVLAEEINADALGLDREPALGPDGRLNPLLNITQQEEFAEELLRPLYGRLGITTLEELAEQTEAVYEGLLELSVKEVLELQGYRFRQDLPSSPVRRGSLLLANAGPGGNRGELAFILDQAPWMNGRYTVLGQIVSGIEVADELARRAADRSVPRTLRPVLNAITRLD